MLLFCSDEYEAEFIKKNPCVTTLDTAPQMSEHEVNTDRVSSLERLINV